MSNKYPKPKFIWDEKMGKATCILKHGNKTFIGEAQCNPVDRDFMTEKVGCTIAERRAYLVAYRYYRDLYMEIVSVLEHLYETMEQGWKEEKPNHQMVLLQREIIRYKTDLRTFRDSIKIQSKDLHQYIKGKEEFYKKIRKNRKNREKGQI